MSVPRKNPKAGAKAGAKTIFNTAAVAAHLEKLREQAVADGKEDTAWWRSALCIEWGELRPAGNNTQWTNLVYTDESGVRGRLTLRIAGERHTGRIMPLTDDGVAELSKLVKNPKVVIKKRDKGAQLQIQRWAAAVKTEADGVTLLKDESGQPVYPDPATRSNYFRVAALVGEMFVTEARERVERGAAYVKFITEQKKGIGKDMPAAAVLQAYCESPNGGARRPGDIILSGEHVATIRRIFSDKASGDLLVKGAIVNNNIKVAELVQTSISTGATKNAGLQLPNPMTRIAMKFDKQTNVAEMSFFDKSKPYIADGKPKYEAATVPDEKTGAPVPVNAENIHKFVTPRCRVDGLVDISSICFSSMGISMPVKGEVFVVEPAASNRAGYDDVYDDGEGDGDEGASVTPAVAPVAAAAPAAAAAAAAAPAAAAAAPTAAAAPVVAAPVAATSLPSVEENYDQLLGELGATA